MIRYLFYRNFLLYFREKASVFFSLLSVIIVLSLYILFLAQLQIDNLENIIGQYVSSDNISGIVHTWILAGLISIITVTSPLGALACVVQDKEKEIVKDFKSSLVKLYKYPVAAVLNSVLIGVIMGVLALSLYSGYIYINNNIFFTFNQIFKSILGIVLSSFSSSAIMGFLVSFFKSTGAFTSASTIIGTVIGFINGLYVPMGSLPEIGQDILKFIPFSNTAMIFRRILMEDTIKETFKDIGIVGQNEYMKSMGVIFSLNDFEITPQISALYVLIIAIMFLILFFIKFKNEINKN